MFVDNECAGFLREWPLCDEVKLKAKIFSLNTRLEFLAYLAELEAATPAEVRAMAEESLRHRDLSGRSVTLRHQWGRDSDVTIRPRPEVLSTEDIHDWVRRPPAHAQDVR
jgi:hypothetical protein